MQHTLNSQPISYTLNVSAITSSFASFLGWLPPTLASIASFLSIIWFAVQIHDSRAIPRFRAWLGSKFSK